MWFSVSWISVLIPNMLFPSHPHGWPSSTKVLDVIACPGTLELSIQRDIPQPHSAAGHRPPWDPRGQLGRGSHGRSQPPMSRQINVSACLGVTFPSGLTN